MTDETQQGPRPIAGRPPKASPWYDDFDELTDFIRWYLGGSKILVGEVLDIIEKPWKWTDEYEAWKEDQKDG